MRAFKFHLGSPGVGIMGLPYCRGGRVLRWFAIHSWHSFDLTENPTVATDPGHPSFAVHLLRDAQSHARLASRSLAASASPPEWRREAPHRCRVIQNLAHVFRFAPRIRHIGQTRLLTSDYLHTSPR